MTVYSRIIIKKLAIIYYLCCCFNYLFLPAQLGNHPNTINWQQINTPHLKIIFPENFEKQAFRVASIIEYMDANNTRSIGDKTHPIQILVHNQTTIPNGFVGVSPYRSEFFATPPQSANTLGSVDWLDALTIHEYRHAQQYANSKVGLSKLAYYLMGENGWGLAVSLIPNWFWEGDAVFTETALSNQGRGRSPFFTRSQRALLLNDINYSYEKARNGSYKDLLPNRYPLGYLMNTYAREKFGNDVWKDIFESAARYRSIIYPFSKALQKKTGLKTKDLYQLAYTEAQKKWKKEQVNLVLFPSKRVSPKPTKTVTSYRFPYYLEDGSVVYVRSSFQKTAGIYKLADGQESKLTAVGFSLNTYLSVTGNKAIWTEFERNPRRAEQNYSTLVTFDFISNKKTRIAKKSRFFSPAYNNVGNKIVTVQVSPDQQNKLVLLNESGEIQQEIPNQENHFISFPKWLADDSGIVYIAKQNSQLAIFKYVFSQQSTEQLTSWTHHNISDLFVKEKQVYFTASFSSIDNIYAIELSPIALKNTRKSFSPSLQQVTSVPIGAYFPSIHPTQNKLIFSQFDEQGYWLAESDLSEEHTSSYSVLEPYHQKAYNINAISEEGGNILNKIPNKQYETSRYKGLLKGLKLHSWNLTPDIAVPSVDIQIDNVLQDFSINFLGGYNLNEQQPFYLASATIGKWYPNIRVYAGSSRRAADFLTVVDTLAKQRFEQHTIGSTVSIPLTWNKGDYTSSVNPWMYYAHRFIRAAKFAEEVQDKFSIGTVGLGINLSNLKRTAYQNVNPRFGQSLQVSYNQTTDGLKSKKVRLDGTFFLPGIGANHSLQVAAAYQKELLSNSYQFSDAFAYSRGYAAPINDEFVRYSLAYQLPLAYSDWGIWGITYFKRIRANVFFDYGKGKIRHDSTTNKYRSCGVEILFDNNFFMELPVTLGCRNTFLVDKDVRTPNKNYAFEFFIRSEFF